MDKKEQVLHLLERNARLTPEQIGVMVELDTKEVQAMIDAFEADGVIVCRKTVIDREKTEYERVSALIELRVTPQMGEGFDLMVMVEGRTMKEVALFVANRLAPMDEVLSTATHFVLKNYKQDGVIFGREPQDERRVITL